MIGVLTTDHQLAIRCLVPPKPDIEHGAALVDDDGPAPLAFAVHHLENPQRRHSEFSYSVQRAVHVGTGLLEATGLQAAKDGPIFSPSGHTRLAGPAEQSAGCKKFEHVPVDVG